MPDPSKPVPLEAVEKAAKLYVFGLGLTERESDLVRGGYLAGATWANSILERAPRDDAVVPSDDRPVRNAPGLNGPSGSPTHSPTALEAVEAKNIDLKRELQRCRELHWPNEPHAGHGPTPGEKLAQAEAERDGA